MKEFEYNSAYFHKLTSGWTSLSIAAYSNRLLATLKERPYPSDGIALDFGCGSGAYLPYLTKSSLKVVGVDTSPEAVRGKNSPARPLRCNCILN
jgi:cyclopropane fatty-acyl-phospholipid synthase-like methyltransferase